MLHLWSAQIWSVCCVTRITVLPATHTRTIPAFTPRPQKVIVHWLVLIAPTHEGMAGLSWPVWLVTYRDRSRVPGIELGHGHPSRTKRAQRRLTSLIERPTGYHYARPPQRFCRKRLHLTVKLIRDVDVKAVITQWTRSTRSARKLVDLCKKWITWPLTDWWWSTYNCAFGWW